MTIRLPIPDDYLSLLKHGNLTGEYTPTAGIGQVYTPENALFLGRPQTTGGSGTPTDARMHASDDFVKQWYDIPTFWRAYNWKDKCISVATFDVNFDSGTSFAIAYSHTTGYTGAAGLLQRGIVFTDSTIHLCSIRTSGSFELFPFNNLNILSSNSYSYTSLTGWNTVKIEKMVLYPYIFSGNPYYSVSPHYRDYRDSGLFKIYINGTHVASTGWTQADNFDDSAQPDLWSNVYLDLDWNTGRNTDYPSTVTLGTKIRNYQEHLTGYDVNGPSGSDPVFTTPDPVTVAEPKDVDFVNTGTSDWYAVINTTTTGTTCPRTTGAGSLPNINWMNKSTSTPTDVRNDGTYEGGIGLVRIRPGDVGGFPDVRTYIEIKYRLLGLGGGYSTSVLVNDESAFWDSLTDSADTQITFDVDSSTLPTGAKAVYDLFFSSDTITMDIFR